MVKNLPTNAGDMAQGDPLEKEMATHTSSLAFEISWTEECDRLSLQGHERVGHELATKQQQFTL